MGLGGCRDLVTDAGRGQGRPAGELWPEGGVRPLRARSEDEETKAPLGMTGEQACSVQATRPGRGCGRSKTTQSRPRANSSDLSWRHTLTLALVVVGYGQSWYLTSTIPWGAWATQVCVGFSGVIVTLSPQGLCICWSLTGMLSLQIPAWLPPFLLSQMGPPQAT